MIFFACCVTASSWILQVPLVTARFESNRFLPKSICAINGSLEEHSYTQADPSASGIFSCVTKCHKAITKGLTCIGAGVDKGGACYTLRPFSEVTAKEVCSEDEKIEVLVVEKSCDNGGEWEGLRGRCQCSGGWVGDRCHRYARNCSELRHHGYAMEKYHVVKLNIAGHGVTPQVLCSNFNDENKLTETHVFANDGAFTFNRTYSEYVDGFYNNKTSFWLGLKWMHILTKEHRHNAMLRIFLIQEHGKYEMIYRLYKGFVLKGASAGYTFDYETVSPSGNTGSYSYNLQLGDCLQSVRGMPFSTADNDQDESLDNCAARAGAGWWFRDCPSLCNPLGLKPKSLWSVNRESMIKMDGIKFIERELFKDFFKVEMLLEVYDSTAVYT